MNLYKIQKAVLYREIDLKIILNKNPDLDFILIGNYDLILGIVSVQELKPEYIKLQIRNKSRLAMIEKLFDAEKIKIITHEFLAFKNINFVGQVSNDGTLYMNKYWRYAEKFKTQ